jgi:hypothetical protein
MLPQAQAAFDTGSGGGSQERGLLREIVAGGRVDFTGAVT